MAVSGAGDVPTRSLHGGYHFDAADARVYSAKA
jgi:hypothetical protein